jgi:hypothetical protein
LQFDQLHRSFPSCVERAIASLSKLSFGLKYSRLRSCGIRARWGERIPLASSATNRY